MRKSCKGCVHYKQISGIGDRYKYCHYAIDTGSPRPYPADNCTVKKTIRKKSAMEIGMDCG